MFAYMKRICAFLLAVVMLFSLLPVGPVHAEEATTSYELTEADYAGVNAVFDLIDQSEEAPAKKKCVTIAKDRGSHCNCCGIG